MKLSVTHQQTYSRGELLLRTFFGWIYITLPHYFILIFIGIWSSILAFISFWSILFTGRYPESFFEFQVGVLRWSLRVSARLYNISDGYPAFGINATDDNTSLEVEYPESLSRGMALLKFFLGWLYCGLPHVFILFFRLIYQAILVFIAFWVVLFTGKYPKSIHEFVEGTIRWGFRLSLYLNYMSDDYPPFTGKAIDREESTDKEIT